MAAESAKRLSVPLREIEIRFVRSSGPGGQNVNKVSTKAVLRWNVAASAGLPDAVRARFQARYSNKLTDEGEMVIASQRFRDQKRNENDCCEKLRAMLEAVARPPTRRKKTRPTRASVERRKDQKRQISQRKERRRWTREE